MESQSQNLSFASYPAVRLLFLFATGLLIGFWVPGFFSTALYLFLTESLIYFIAHKWFNKKFNIYWYRLSLATYLLLVVTIGYLSFQLSIRNHGTSLPVKTLQVFTTDTVTFHGEILSTKTSGYYHQYIVKVESFAVSAQKDMKSNFKILVFDFNRKSNNSMPKQGEQVVFKGLMTTIPDVRNPHEFNYKHYLASKNIHLECQLVRFQQIIKSNNNYSWFWWRNKINKIINRNFNHDNVPVAMALLLGDKSALSPQTKSNFSKAGISHLLAVSGLHVGFIIMPFWFFIPWFWYHKHGKPFAVLLIGVLLFVYAGITGFRLSVIRASIMAFLFLYARLYQKRSNSINLLATAALLILIFDPNALFDISFQLSFGAVTVILLLYPVIQQSLPAKWKYGKLSFLPTIIIISIIVQFGLFPLMAWYFHQFSLIAPVTNIFAIPMSQFIVLWSWICIGIGVISPVVGHLANWPSNLLVTALRSLSQHLTMFKWSWINVQIPSIFLFVVWISALMLLASWYNTRIRWKWFIMFLVSLVIIQIPEIYHKLQPSDLTLTVFDVGEGDALFLHTPDNKHIMIDTGVWHPNSNSGNKILVPELQAMGIHHLNAIILTHPHADHIGGIIPLLKTFRVDTIYNSGIPHNSNLYHNYLKLAHLKHIPVKHLYRGYPLNLDPSIGVFVLAPGKHMKSSDDNRQSIVLKITYGKTSFLLTGDAEKKTERKMDHIFGHFLRADFLKVAHHGSNTSSSQAFLNWVSPRIATVSVGIHNRYHLPDIPVLKRVIRMGAKIHYTSFENALIFKSDGQRIREVKWK